MKTDMERLYKNANSQYQKTDMAVLFAEQTNECYFNAMLVVFRNRLKRYLETNKSGHFKLV